MIRVALFDSRAYEEVEADHGATGQALGVVLLASIATGLGWVGLGSGRGPAIVMMSVTAIATWVFWAVLIYVIGTRLLPERQTRSDVGELLRTIGFAQSPGVLRIAAVAPGIGAIANGVVVVWTLATMIVAVRQALDYSTTMRAVAVVVLGWLVSLAMFVVIGSIFAPTVS